MSWNSPYYHEKGMISNRNLIVFFHFLASECQKHYRADLLTRGVREQSLLHLQHPPLQRH